MYISILQLRLLILGSVLLAISMHGYGQSFTIEDIRIEGLQRISVGTVFNYLPTKIGETITPQNSARLIRALYKTHFFAEITLARDNNILIIQLKEQPAIGQIEISGNQDIETDNLKAALKDIGLAEGRVFNRSILDKIEQELRRQYFSRGKYAVSLETTITPLERNRVAIKLKISEGLTARIKQINIIGNSAFTESEILDLFELGTPNWLSFLTHNDRYSKPKLTGDLETLRSFYLDHGYVDFAIQSTQVTISSDKKDIFITANIHEGAVYTISDLKLAGHTILPPEQLFPLIELRRGTVYAHGIVTASATRISNLLGDHGYAFATVNPIPDVNQDERRVAITFFIDPGKRVYVRRINVYGNTKTRDEVLRRELRQLESAWYSGELINRSRERLQRLGFFEEVKIATPAVAGSADAVDMNITVTEKSSGTLAASVGYSQSDGLIFSTSITQHNFLGTGKQMSLGFNNSSSNTLYRLSYNNPYYTIDGISRGFKISYSKTDYSELNTLNYITNVGEAGVNFGLPISDTAQIGLELGYVNTDLRAGTSTMAQEFADENGTQFNDYRVTLSWRDDSRDAAQLPKRGAMQRLALILSTPLSDLEFYKIIYTQDRYLPLWGDLILNLNGEVGYGDGLGSSKNLPFFENFFAGGPRSVRGFRQNTLGPKESATDVDSDPIGGNFKLIGSAEVIWPSLFGEQFAKTARLTTFLDMGNVWQVANSDNRESDGIAFSDLRYSLGIGASWLSPIGALSISLGFPLNAQDGDQVENFQFNLGQTF